MINVLVKFAEPVSHISSLLTGFHLLSEQGKIRLKIEYVPQLKQILPSTAMIEVIINEKIKIAFDVLDGYNWDESKLVNYLHSDVLMLFKRSFSIEKNKNYDDIIQSKLRPLGFNYYVTYKNNPMDRITAQSIKGLCTIIKEDKFDKYFVDNFENQIWEIKKNPKILFCTRLWNPKGTDIKQDNKLMEEREYINAVRIEIIKQLKREYKSNFVGGLYGDRYAIRKCPELILPPMITSKRKYLEIMKNTEICIGSMGLHESIGWKTAEYVAAGRSIVCEQFRYEVPGDFKVGKNYLSYTNVQQCMEAVGELWNNPEEIIEMSANNVLYYNQYLRPDMQIWNAITCIIN